MADRLLGIETEYAITALSSKGKPLGREALVSRLLERMTRVVSCLPGYGGGVFLENGSRFYIDVGLHPELCTPECTDPLDVVRYVLAGERLLTGVVKEIEHEHPGDRGIHLFKCNVDYSGAGSTWGCHESYLHQTDAQTLSAQIIPHLVSRVIYSGAGGFNPLSPGLEFTLSPRVPHISRIISEQSTSNRGIFHTKDEPLSKQGYHRLHVICGESLSSQTSMWLKLATTALVVVMAEAGLNPGSDLELDSPLDALRAIAGDPDCSTQVKLKNERFLTAVEIQHSYLQQVESHLNDSFMPGWAKEACCLWRATLDRLLDGPRGVRGRLDWAIKYALYSDHVRRRGFEWRSLGAWTRIVASIRAALSAAGHNAGLLNTRTLLTSKSPIRDEIERLKPRLLQNDLRWDDLNRFVALRQELFEIDTRFGQLGDEGIFRTLECAGVLSHELPGLERVEEAMTSPPARGRARLRGEAIKELNKMDGEFRCDWQGIWDCKTDRFLDLSDPFETDKTWQVHTEGGNPESRAAGRISQLLQRSSNAMREVGSENRGRG